MNARKPKFSLLTIRIELFGTARTVCGRRHVDVELPEQVHVSGITAAIAEKCPELLGKVILEATAKDAARLQSSFVFNLNGVLFVDRKEELSLKPGDTILLISSLAGG